jgi:hypothetical protein
MKTTYFTICAKNYLAQAYVLGTSVKKYCPDDSFYVVLVDEIDDCQISKDFIHLTPKSCLLDINIDELAFKYNVIEFSTSVKPFFIEYFFNNGFDNVVYLDPDMVVYQPLLYLKDQLNIYDFIITPHIRKPYKKYFGSTPEEEILFVGIYNLGFFAVKNSNLAKDFIQWWKEKLLNQCYADKLEALHVDQKWLDFLPSFYPGNVLIELKPTINMASWSIHEVDFTSNKGQYYIDSQPLLIYHFSGIDITDKNSINKKQLLFDLINKPEYTELFKEYKENVISNNYDYYKSFKYKYDFFTNGIYIDSYLRRLFRLTITKNIQFNKMLFETNSNDTLFSFFKKHKLLIGEKEPKYFLLKTAYKNADKKIYFLEQCLLLLKKVIGIKYYFFLIRFFSNYIKFENQSFLIK